jgi:hypothetical protein
MGVSGASTWWVGTSLDYHQERAIRLSKFGGVKKLLTPCE